MLSPHIRHREGVGEGAPSTGGRGGGFESLVGKVLGGPVQSLVAVDVPVHLAINIERSIATRRSTRRLCKA